MSATIIEFPRPQLWPDCVPATTKLMIAMELARRAIHRAGQPLIKQEIVDGICADPNVLAAYAEMPDGHKDDYPLDARVEEHLDAVEMMEGRRRCRHCGEPLEDDGDAA
jgi:hypothetical protein